MGLKLALATVSVALAASPAGYVASHQQPDGGFAEPGGRSDPTLTAWATLGLVASGQEPSAATAEYLAGQPAPGGTDLALRILALDALGLDTTAEVARLEALRRPDGRIGPLVNSTIWGVLALRSADRPAKTSVSYILRAQHSSGGWAWYPRGSPDSNDTAAAVQALRAGGVGARSRPIRRAFRYLHNLQRRDGGFPLGRGRASDAQSTAWVIQAYLAARRDPGGAPFRYLVTLRRPNGSYRYSRSYATTPVWVTSQVLAALARKPFPLR